MLVWKKLIFEQSRNHSYAPNLKYLITVKVIANAKTKATTVQMACFFDIILIIFYTNLNISHSY